VPTRLERWDTPDGDFLELLRHAAPSTAPRLLLLHGLEGSPRSHYVRGLMTEAERRGWAADLLVFRSCGTALNRAPRFYHSGETSDLGWVVSRLIREEPGRPLLLAGVSLGGNVLLKWLGEQSTELPHEVVAAAAVSVPYDLARGARHIERGFSRVYQAHFLRSLRRKALQKHRQFPDRIDARAVARARTLWEFDDAVTAPLHGFRDAADYYARSSSMGWIDRIRIPTLLLSAVDDPFLPATVLQEVARLAAGNPHLHPDFVSTGGHVGFVAGRVPWRPIYWGEWRATEFLAGELARRVERTAVAQ
jgi:predicted alpha/beta-fold hydrolase